MREYTADRITVEEGLERIFAEIPHGIPEETALLDAMGCVLEEDLLASADQPPFPRSPLDGYAVRAEDLKGATAERPAVLTVVAEEMAGHRTHRKVGKGEAVRIMTGAPIPAGADCVVKQEDTDYGEDWVQIFTPLAPYENYCFQGEDFRKGDCLVRKGTEMNCAAVAAAAGMGRDRVLVCRRPRVAVLTTGDELTEPGRPLPDGGIYNMNLYLVTARLKELGLDPVTAEQAGDSEEGVAERIRKAAETADLIITTGGVSVGKKDIMHGALRLLGARRLFWKLQMKPGMPTLCAVWKNTLILGLSGNPFGVAVGMEMLVRPVLARLWKKDGLLAEAVEGILENGFEKENRVRRMVRAVYDRGTVRVPDGCHSSGAISSMVGCNCLIDVLPGTEGLDKGSRVRVILL